MVVERLFGCGDDVDVAWSLSDHACSGVDVKLVDRRDVRLCDVDTSRSSLHGVDDGVQRADGENNGCEGGSDSLGPRQEHGEDALRE